MPSIYDDSPRIFPVVDRQKHLRRLLKNNTDSVILLVVIPDLYYGTKSELDRDGVIRRTDLERRACMAKATNGEDELFFSTSKHR